MPSLAAANSAPLHLGYSFVVALVVLAIGVVVFNQVEKNFMDTV